MKNITKELHNTLKENFILMLKTADIKIALDKIEANDKKIK